MPRSLAIASSAGRGLLLDGQAVVHHLGVEVLLAEDVLEVGRRLPGAVLLAGAQPHVDLARRAAGRGDQALAVALEQVAVEARLAVLALEAGQRGDAEEVVHALRGAGQQGHVGVGGLAAVGPAVTLLVEELVAEVERRAVEARAGRVVALHADDRLDPGRVGLLVEVVGAEHVAVVGHRQRRHARARRRPSSPRAASPRRRASSTRCARAGATNEIGAGCSRAVGAPQWSCVPGRRELRRATGGEDRRCAVASILAWPRSTPRV